MTDKYEAEFKAEVLKRLTEAALITGESFFGALSSIEEMGAIATARRLIADRFEFQEGVRKLKIANRLDLSIEQAVIDFHAMGKAFDDEDAEKARARLLLIDLMVQWSVEPSHG